MSKQAQEPKVTPPLLRIRAQEWRPRFRRLTRGRRVGICADLAEYWQLGLEMAQTLTELEGTASREKLAASLASEMREEGDLGSPALVRDLVSVGTIFAAGTLAQSWSWHVAQSRRLRPLSEEERRAELQTLAKLPPGQSVRDVPKPPGRQRKWEGFGDVPKGRGLGFREATLAYNGLSVGDKLTHTLDCLQDLVSLRPTGPGPKLFIAEIHALAEQLLHPTAPDGLPPSEGEPEHAHSHHSP